MMRPLISAYIKINPGVSILMEKPLGSDGAKKALLAGALDIAVSSKGLTPDEMEKGASIRQFGKTPLAIVTGKGLKIRNITIEDLEKVYTGAMAEWPNGVKVRPVLRPMRDIDTTILKSLSPGMDKAITIAQRRPGMIIAVTDPESNEIVSKTAGGIGASGLTGVITGNDRLTVLTLNGVKPRPETLADGTYPMAKEINFVTTRRTSRAASRFLDFIFSKKGRAIALKTGVLVTAEPGARK
jgi:phosphate transport system substrate-binding protein